MLDQLEELKQKALQELTEISDIKELESWRVRYLGKKSELVKTLRSLGTLPLEERKATGAYANEVKTSLEKRYRKYNWQLQLRKTVLISLYLVVPYPWVVCTRLRKHCTKYVVYLPLWAFR